MIIEMLLDVIYNLFYFLTTPISIPSLPDEIHSFIADFLDLISMGVGLLANYTHISYILLLFGVIVSIDVGLSLYHFIMWVIKKIPMLNVS